MVETTKPYHTAHGVKFEKKADAKNYEAYIKASDEFKRARRQLQKVLARMWKTADGQEFDYQEGRTFYYVRRRYDRAPTLSEIHLTYSNPYWKLSEIDYDGDCPCIVWCGPQKENPSPDIPRDGVRIDMIFADRRNADIALLDAMNTRIAEEQGYASEFSKRLFPFGRPEEAEAEK